MVFGDLLWFSLLFHRFPIFFHEHHLFSLIFYLVSLILLDLEPGGSAACGNLWCGSPGPTTKIASRRPAPSRPGAGDLEAWGGTASLDVAMMTGCG